MNCCVGVMSFEMQQGTPIEVPTKPFFFFLLRFLSCPLAFLSLFDLLLPRSLPWNNETEEQGEHCFPELSWITGETISCVSNVINNIINNCSGLVWILQLK